MAKWVKGESGNPGGRPKGLERQVRSLIDFEQVTKALQDIVLKQNAGVDAPHRDRIAAAKLLYERGYGRPREHVKIEADLNAESASDGEIDWSALDEAEGEALEQILRQIVAGGDSNDDTGVH